MKTIADYTPTEGWLADWCEHLQGRVMAPPEFILASGLTALSASIGNTVRFWLGGWRWPHLWLLLVAPAGARKSTPAAFAQAAIEIARGETGLLPRRWSPEAFLENLASSPDGLWYAGEFSGFLEQSRARKNGSYMAGARNDLCDIWDGGRFIRKTRKDTITVRDCAPTAIATGRGSDFQDQAGADDFASGFMSRWLVVLATSPGGYVGIDTEANLLDDADPHWQGLCRHLGALRDTFGRWGADGGLIYSTKAQLTDEAARLHRSYDEPWAHEELPDELSGWGSRRGIYAAKLAILHCISRTGSVHVEATDVAWGIAIVKTAWKQIQSLTSGVIGLSEAVRNREKVYEIGAQMVNGSGEAIRLSEWLRAAHRYVRDAREFHAMLDTFAEMGRIKLTSIGTGRGPKARAAWFEHQEAPL